MNFTQAIQAGFANYASFSGRASRGEYWFFALFTTLVSVVATTLDVMVFSSAMASGLSPLSLVWCLAVLLPGFGLLIRRLHDIGKSGWAWLICLIPFVGIILLIVWLCRPGTEGVNQYGPNPLGGLGIGPAPIAA